jgi:hypothetical protein
LNNLLFDPIDGVGTEKDTPFVETSLIQKEMNESIGGIVEKHPEK